MTDNVTGPGNEAGAGDRRSSRTTKRSAGLALNLLVAAASVVFTVLVLELALRVYHGALFDFSSQLVLPANRTDNPVAQYDTLLGWVPRPGSHERSDSEKWFVNEAGVRSNGSSLTSDARPIVVVGDSFTFGDEVLDHETWPARLEARLGVPVINGGVFAYGVDQAYLRATRLIEEYDPAVVLLAFISDDIFRNERSFYSGWKPYFTYEDGELTLRNVPVPSGTVPLPRFARLRHVLGYSYLSSALLRRFADRWWSYGGRPVHGDGGVITLELFDRLDALARSRNADFAVVALATGGRIGSGNLRAVGIVEQARERGIPVIDFIPEVERMPPDSIALMFRARGHFSPPMNARVAERIASFLDDRGP